MVSLIEACENIKQALSELPIELLVIDTISNPISLLMNKGQMQGNNPDLQRMGNDKSRPCVNAIIYKSLTINDDTI